MDKVLSQNEFLNLIHDCNLEMLSYLKEICTKNDIPFYLWGGTLLGAVRHKDFIPWDDDADVVMFKKDFEKLKAAIEKSPDERFEFENNFESEVFIEFISKIVYKDSKIHSDADDFTVDQLHLDIFLLNNTSDRKFFRVLHGLLLKFIYGMAMGHREVSRINERFEYSFVQRLSARTLSILGKLVPFTLLKKWHNAAAGMFDGRDTGYVFCTNNAPTCLGEKHSHPRKVYEKTIWAPFRGTEMPVPSGYDVILTSGYPNYMQLPPPEKRKPDHLVMAQAVVKGYRCEEIEDAR